MNCCKKIVSYTEKNTFCVLIPVYYEYENKPAWKKVFSGSLDECEKEIKLYPDYMRATYEENQNNRKK